MLGINQDLREKAEKKISTFNRVLKTCLKVKNEEILVITDYGAGEKQLAAMVGHGFYKAALNKGYKAGIIFQDTKKGFMQADTHVVNTLSRLEDNSIVILSLSNKLGRLGPLGKSFRNFCKDKNLRFVSSSGLGGVNSGQFDIFSEAIDVNYNRMRKHGVKLKSKLDRAKEIKVKTEKGTNLTFNVDGKQAIAMLGIIKKLELEEIFRREKFISPRRD